MSCMECLTTPTHTQKSEKGMITMRSEKEMTVWGEVLNDLCCKPNEVTGNRPCDNGVLCDRCTALDVQEEYERRIKEVQ